MGEEFGDEGAEWGLCKLCALLPTCGQQVPGVVQCAAWAPAPQAWADGVSEDVVNYSQRHHTGYRS